MTVCYFGLYKPDYSRNLIIIKGLRSNGVKVVECNVRRHLLWGLRYWHLWKKFWPFRHKIDIVIVGFPGHSDVPLAWLLCRMFNKKLVFDAFISLYNTQIDDRRYVKTGTWKAAVCYYLDKVSCQLADLVLLDTQTHIDYFVQTFKLDSRKFTRVFIGSDENLFLPEKNKLDENLLVGYHGSYLPLQGVEYIVRAAAILKNNKWKFKLVGDGIERAKCEKLSHDLMLTNVEFVDSLPYSGVPEFINSCDISLGGHFGNNKKAGLVIANKVFEAVACARPVIVGDSPAVRELFADGVNCLMVKRGSSQDLAMAIEKLVGNHKLKLKIATGGRKTFLASCTTKVIGKQVKFLLLNL